MSESAEGKKSVQREAPAARDETIDSLFGGRVKLYQSRSGYRFSLDAVLLAHFVALKARAKVIDLGAGNGAVTLMLAALHPTAFLTGVEIQTQMLRRARRSVSLNRMEDRAIMVQGDARNLKATIPGASFDAAVCNPPYRPPLSGRISHDAERRIARHEFAGTLKHFLGAGSYALNKKGRMYLVYPSCRLVDLLTTMRAVRIEPKRLRMVHSFEDTEASLVLVEGVKDGKSAIVVEDPLIVYDRRRRYGSEVETMLRGASAKERDGASAVIGDAQVF